MPAKKPAVRELIDTIEYVSDARVNVKIELWRERDGNFTVALSQNRQTSTRSFASEEQANRHILNLQS